MKIIGSRQVAVGAGFVLALFSMFARATSTFPAPLGAEALVNQTTTGSQTNAKVARDADGDYVVVWEGNGPGDSAGIFARLYDASGNPKGSEFLVNAGSTSGTQSQPAVAMDANGEFIIAWTSDDGSGDLNVHDELYNAGGVNQSGSVINTYTTGNQSSPAVAMDASGNSVVVWQGAGSATISNGIFGQRIFANGILDGSNFQVDVTSSDTVIGNAAIARDPAGEFVVAWTVNQNTDYNIFARRFDGTGAPVAAPFKASNSASSSDEDHAAVAMDASGSFIIAWDTDPVTTGGDIYYAQFLNGVNQVGDIQASSSVSDGIAQYPGVSMSADGRFVLAWAIKQSTGSDQDVRSQYHAADRSRIDNWDPVSQASGFDQARPSIAVDADGDYVIVWASNGQDGSGDGIYARPFAGTENVDLAQTLTDSADPVARGAAYSYTATITNLHASPTLSGNASKDAYLGAVGTATGITTTVTLPSGASSISGSGTNWSCSGTTTLSCAYSGKLAPGANTVLTVSLNAPSNGGTANASATADGNQHDSAQPNNTDTEATTVNPQPDVTPDAFSFTDQGGVEPSTQVTSAAVTISGIEQAVAISVTGGSYSIGCTATYTTSAGTVSNGQTVCVRHTSSANFSTATNTTLTAGGVSDTFTSTTRAADTTPNAFTFTDQGNVNPSTATTSNTVAISGIEQPAAISVTGGSYSIGCTASFTTAAGTIANGQTVCVQQTSSASFSTPTDTVLTVGGVSDTFTVTTRAGSTTPAAFAFTDQTGAAPAASVTSNTVTISGNEVAAPISVTGGEYSIGCTASFTAAAGTIAPGQTVCLRLTTSASASTTTSATLTVGGVSDTWNVTTADAPAAGGGGGGAFGGPALLLLGLAGALRRRRQ